MEIMSYMYMYYHHVPRALKSTLSVHSTNAIQTAAVTIISYKPLSDLKFARYTIMYGSYRKSSNYSAKKNYSNLRVALILERTKLR